MTRSSRIRRGIFYVAGILLLLLSAALAASWVRSWNAQDSFYRTSVDQRGAYTMPMVVSDNGRLAFIYRYVGGPSVGVVRTQGWKHMARPHFFEFEEVRFAAFERIAAGPGMRGRVQVVVRYWLLILITLLLGWAWVRVAMRLRKRFAAGLCRGCGYDLRGNTSGVCPECGSELIAGRR